MIEIADIKLLFAAKFPYTVHADISWPQNVTHKGKTYRWYDKEGWCSKGKKRGMPSACYARNGDAERVWLNLDGTITED